MVYSRSEYAPVAYEDDSDEDKTFDDVEDDSSSSTCNECRGRLALQKKPLLSKFEILLLCTVSVLAFTLGAATTYLIPRSGDHSAQVYTNDFAPARQSVELEDVRFTGTAMFDDTGEPFFNYGENDTRYVGKPTKAIDRAWDELIKHRFFLVDDDEAREAWGPDYEKYYKYPPSEERPEGGYVAELDVLHTLHCVNVLRKTIYKSHYKHHHGSKAFQQYHVDHCIDIVRQSVQCQGDLTLIPTRWWESYGKDGKNFIDSDQVHTCRSFPKIREWATERWNNTHRPFSVKGRPRPTNLVDAAPER